MALRVVSNYLRLPQKTFWILDTLAYHAKSMYNVGLYNVRQHYATHRENRQILLGLRPDLTSGVDILVGSYLPFIVTGLTSLKHTSDSGMSAPISPNKFSSPPVSQMPVQSWQSYAHSP